MSKPGRKKVIRTAKDYSEMKRARAMEELRDAVTYAYELLDAAYDADALNDLEGWLFAALDNVADVRRHQDA